MEKTNFSISHLKAAIFAGTLLSIFALGGCANQKPQIRASQYRFNYDGEAYRLRSISSENTTEFYNELVGANFVAVDFDQDRTLDRILLGEVSLAEAQKIYEHGLERLARENKLHVRIPRVNRYVHEKNDFQIEIRSFRPANAQPFNEFVVTDNRPVACPETIIIVDHHADGTLDETLKGTATPAELQSKYAKAIEAGLQKGELLKANQAILVKEK
ncbi:hypothetical protein L0337_31935 [candidate division KSB1 bacterium]|nr:hypothetical protein [candidate division KSB1 bacterium]